MSSRSVNRVILLGTIGRDAETKKISSGAAVTTFSMATNRRWKDRSSGEWKEEPEWHSCVLWDAEKVAPFLLRGKQIYVEGRLQTRTWEKDGQKHSRTEVVASEVILCGGGSRDDSGPVSQPRSAQRSTVSDDGGWGNEAF